MIHKTTRIELETGYGDVIFLLFCSNFSCQQDRLGVYGGRGAERSNDALSTRGGIWGGGREKGER